MPSDHPLLTGLKFGGIHSAIPHLQWTEFTIHSGAEDLLHGITPEIYSPTTNDTLSVPNALTCSHPFRLSDMETTCRFA